MRPPRRFRPDRANPRLRSARYGDRTELWTETVGTPPPAYGERWAEAEGRSFRTFEPFRSKLAAALVREWAGPLPAVGERWLYLGAASGTTASHVADLLGPEGRLYAVERSLRPFARLLDLSVRWPNLLPILADAREPRRYADLVPPTDGLYADVAQPDQLEIVLRNAELFLARPGAKILVALKTASMGRNVGPATHLARAEELLEGRLALAPSVKLDPFHRAHYLVGGTARALLFEEATSSAARPPTGSSRGPRRR